MKPRLHTGRRQALRVAMGLGLGLGIGPRLGLAAGSTPARPGAALAWRERAMLAFGTTVWMRAGHAQAAAADAALDAAVAAVQQVDQQMSLFRPDSAVCRLNREGVLRQPPADLVALLRLAQRVAARSAGSFDVTVQPLWQLWQSAHAQGRRPNANELRAARRLVGWRGLQVDDDVIRLARPGMGITLNGIAQGHAADQARQALLRHGVVDALLDTGEWLALGAAPSAADAADADHAADANQANQANHANGSPVASRPSAWRLGVADPHHGGQLLGALVADGRALACSSDDKLFFSADRRDHHILDPHTGLSPTQLSTVVVAAASAALADALTKPMFMGSAADALALARRWGVDVLTVDKAGRIAASPGLYLQRGG